MLEGRVFALGKKDRTKKNKKDNNKGKRKESKMKAIINPSIKEEDKRNRKMGTVARIRRRSQKIG
jgi:hypothetical protein